MRTKKSLLLERIERFHFPPLTKIISLLEGRSLESYSAYGEDAIIYGLLKRYLFATKESFELSYIDIGAWKPVRESNTYLFYKLGLFGTAVEPNPNLRYQWRVMRPKDQFFGIGCSDKPSETLQIFHANASSNTFSKQFAKTIESSQMSPVTETCEVECLSLKEIIARHKQVFPGPYFLDIDVEGFDLQVLNTYDFKENRPVLVAIEDTSELSTSPIHLYLQGAKYELIGRTIITSLYIDLTQDLARVLNSSH